MIKSARAIIIALTLLFLIFGFVFFFKPSIVDGVMGNLPERFGRNGGVFPNEMGDY